MDKLQQQKLAEMIKDFPGIEWETGEDTFGNPCIGVAVDEVWITDPFISDCGRFDAKPEVYGLTVESGTALIKANVELLYKRLEPQKFNVSWLGRCTQKFVDGNYFTEAKGYSYYELAQIASLIYGGDWKSSLNDEDHIITRIE